MFMFNETHKKKRTLLSAILTITLIAVLPLATFGQAAPNAVQFVNVVDNTQGFSSFGSAPAVNNLLAVAFESAGTGSESVSRWYNGQLTLIATSTDKIHKRFGDVVVINSDGRVGFTSAVVTGTGSDSIIATGDGGPLTVIASANAAGLVGGTFLPISGINERGDVVFLAFRRGFGSQAIFRGNGGPLTPVVDTTNSTFTGLGNTDIDAAGRIVFQGFLADGTAGLFVSDKGLVDVVDTTNPNLNGFLDPVINNNGTVGSAAFLTNGGMAAFTANARGITPRTDGTSFPNIDNVGINNSGEVAFFATDTAGRDGIFVERTGGNNPEAVIQTGDPLFGSTVVALSIGRFSLNDGGWIAFRYQLADGRFGIALAH
jgi:hypothetical protein